MGAEKCYKPLPGVCPAAAVLTNLLLSCSLFCSLQLCRLFFCSVLEAFENSPRVIGGLVQGFEDTVSHLNGGLKGSFFAAVLAIGEVLGELVPFAADTQAPSLEGRRLVGVPSDVALCHGFVLIWCVSAVG